MSEPQAIRCRWCERILATPCKWEEEAAPCLAEQLHALRVSLHVMPSCRWRVTATGDDGRDDSRIVSAPDVGTAVMVARDERGWPSVTCEAVRMDADG